MRFQPIKIAKLMMATDFHWFRLLSAKVQRLSVCMSVCLTEVQTVVSFSFCLILFFMVNYVQFSPKQNIFSQKTSFCQFNKHGFLRSEENVILYKFQHLGLWVFACSANIFGHSGEWDTTFIVH